MEKKQKPDWWPDNPYPETVFPMKRDQYSKIVPNERVRTALSGMLGREFWDIASETIWDAVEEQIEQLQAELDHEKQSVIGLEMANKSLSEQIEALNALLDTGGRYPPNE